MSQVLTPLWDERFRNNVSSDLLISGTKGITISDDSRYTGSSNLAVMFYIDAITLVGDCIIKGATILTISELGLRAGDKTLVIINSDGTWYKKQEKQSGTLTKDWTVAGDIKVGQTNNPEFTISHLAFIDSIITQKKVDLIHTHGGIILNTLHDSIKGHWPCQNAYDDGVNNVTPDVVSQYNKTVLLSDNHGVLSNYTDNELGIPNPSSQTVIKDFYEKDLINNNSLKIFRDFKMFTLPDPGLLNSDLSYQVEFWADDTLQSSLGTGKDFFGRGLSFVQFSVRFESDGSIRSRYDVDGPKSEVFPAQRSIISDVNNGNDTYRRVVVVFENGRQTSYLFEGRASKTPKKIETAYSGYLTNISEILRAGVGFATGDLNMISWKIWEAILPENEIIENKYIAVPDVVDIVGDTEGTQIYNHADSAFHNLISYVASDFPIVKEIDSHLTPRRKALPISVGQDITFGNVGMIKGITFFIQTATDNIELFELISGDANSKISIVAGVLTFGSSFTGNVSFVNGFEQSDADIGKQINVNTWNVVSLFFDTFNATNLITKFTDGSKLASILCYSEMPVEYKLKTNDVNNNILYNNPSVNDQADIAFGWNFNDSSFSGNIDFDSDINTLTASANGFTDLATLLGLLEKINDSR